MCCLACQPRIFVCTQLLGGKWVPTGCEASVAYTKGFTSRIGGTNILGRLANDKMPQLSPYLADSVYAKHGVSFSVCIEKLSYIESQRRGHLPRINCKPIS